MKWKIINDEWINDYKKYNFNSMCIKKNIKRIYLYIKKTYIISNSTQLNNLKFIYLYAYNVIFIINHHNFTYLKYWMWNLKSILGFKVNFWLIN